MSYSDENLDGFELPVSRESWGIGQPYETDTSNSQDPFGRSTSDTASGGVTTSASYTNADGTTSWFGPASTTAADGSVTNYTYTISGQVATKIIYAGSNHSVEYSYVYDAAGNMVKQTQTPVNASGAPDGTPLVTTYAYDGHGRLTQEVDNAGGTDITANRTTTYNYAPFDGTYNTTTVTYPDGSTQITKTYLDGTTASVSGTAATPETNSEGVVSQDTTDANGKIETAGSTWTMISTNGGADWTTAYTNMLGQVYLVQQSTPTGSANPYVDSTTTYNANGQAIETVDFNGTATYTIYDPITGLVGATWVDVNGDGVFTPGVDSKTVYTPTPWAYNASTPAGVDTQTLSATGVQDDDQLTWNGGLNSSDTVDGMTTSTQTIYDGNGSYRILTTNPDGTQVQDIYTDGLLTEEDQLDSGEGLIAKTTYTYNGMRQLATQTDNTGTTVYAYFQDGTQKSVTPPGQPATTLNTLDSGTEDPTNVTNPDGSTTSQTENGLGETLTQSGADVLGATYGYNGNGQITSLTTAAGTTTWAYDPDSGALQSESFADGTSDTYQYNADGQMTSLTEPGMTGTFRYDAYGDLTGSTYMDSATGLVQSNVGGEDDQGRPVIMNDTDNGQSNTETDAYNSVGDLQSESFGSAGNTSVSYGYYGAGATAGSNGGDSDALQSLTASTPGGQSVSQSYTYDSAGRLASITVNGIVISYSYAPNSDQVETIGASPTGANLGDDFVNETYSPDSADGSRLGSISVGAGNSQAEGQMYDASYGYNNDNQIASDQISQTDSGGNTTTQSLNYTYDPNQADALTQVTDGSGDVLYNYAYDGTGNFSGNSTLGSANNVDEYSNFTYNARHDLTNDGTCTYGYDALDRLISITPDSPTSGMLSAQYGYDSQGRMLWENVYGYTGSAWGLSTTYHYVWSGDELIEKLDANNNVLQQYTWGPGWNGQEQLIALTDFTQGSPTTYLLSYDASGNVTMLLNPAAGTVAATYSYTPYGALVSATGPAEGINPFLGKGYWTDTAVDPMLGFAQPDTADGTTRETQFTLGVWLQNDPTGFNGGLNPTSVDGNDPINNVDSDGLKPEPAQDHALTDVNGKPLAQEQAIRQFVARAEQIEANAELVAAQLQDLTNRFKAIASVDPYNQQSASEDRSHFQKLAVLQQALNDYKGQFVALAQEYSAAGLADVAIYKAHDWGQEHHNEHQSSSWGGGSFGTGLIAAIDAVNTTSQAFGMQSDLGYFAAIMPVASTWVAIGDAVVASGVAAETAETGQTTLQQLERAASRAAKSVGPGRGAVYGTQMHTAFSTEVQAIGGSLQTEVSYLNGVEVEYGTPGSVRLDVAEYDVNGQLKAVYDLKTGSAKLTQARIQQIQSQIPGGANVPVIEVRP